MPANLSSLKMPWVRTATCRFFVLMVATTFLHFDEVNSIRTVFMVVNRNPGNTDSTSAPHAYAFHPGVNTVWSSSWTDTAILNGLFANGNTKDG